MSILGPTCGPLPAYGTVYDTLEQLIESCKSHAVVNGYALVIEYKKPNATNPTRVVLRCSRGRSYRPNKRSEKTDESKKRQGSSQMCGCPVMLAGRKRQNDSKWVTEAYQGTADTSHETHNHAADLSSAFPAFRASQVQSKKAEILRLWNSGIRPSKILTSLREQNDVKDIQLKDIQNLTAKHRREELAGRTPIQWLYDTLQGQGDDYWFKEKRNDQGQVQYLFIAPRTGIELYRRHPFVLKMDCTYKTNRFNMPLLNICGTTSQRKAPNLGICLMPNEQEVSFAWCLRQIQELLEEYNIPRPTCVISDKDLALLNALSKHPFFGLVPHLLCLWHINMNVLAKTKKHFPPGERERGTGVVHQHPQFKIFLQAWKKLLDSPDESTYTERLRQFQSDKEFSPAAVKYAINTWITPWKEKLVICWTNQVCIFFFFFNFSEFIVFYF